MEQLMEPPDQFPFAFQPYEIQKAFMCNLYMALERGKVGIFESPTGTGKTMSMICGALKWLRDNEQREKERVEKILSGTLPVVTSTQVPESSGNANKSTAVEPDWFTAFDEQKTQKEAAYRLKQETEAKLKRQERLKQLKERLGSNGWRAKKRKDSSPQLVEPVELEEDDDVIVADYISEDEKAEDSDTEEEETEEEIVTKIYFCSRTHSQLTQFVREVKKSPFGDGTSAITLGSRQNLCINDQVTQLKSQSLINERCLELQKDKKKVSSLVKDDGSVVKKRSVKGDGKCPFYKPGPLENFSALALAEVQDIEELVTLGRHLKACPYYGTRHTVPSAQLVVVPYSTLLHEPTRRSVGLKLKGNVVVIDEAHNLVDSISSAYSVEVTGAHVTKTHSQLSQYLERYRTRLKAKNLLYINQLLHVLTCLTKILGESEPSASRHKGAQHEDEVKLMRLNDFLFSAALDHVNLFKILKYCERSQISRKLHGFGKMQAQGTVPVSTQLQSPLQADPSLSCSIQQSSSALQSGSTQQPGSPLVLVEAFLGALTSADKDGRIVVSQKSNNLQASSLKFLLLNPAVHFASIVQEARAVIVAGGTMQPMSEFHQLFQTAGVRPERIVEFSCGHVIPPDHLLPLCLCKGPSGVEFDFTYQNRDNTHLIDELGRTIANLCMVVPGGVVCFFPSYEYEKKVHAHWSTSGTLEKIGKKKQVFREPSAASHVDQVLSGFAKCIQFNAGDSDQGLNGALLLSVVGGKLSEGINFSDDLGRCIIMVGLPYPNITSPELKEKMDYLSSTVPRSSDGCTAGQVYCDNQCMKAVNQSIGRSIRHSKDYATIVLLDVRYGKPSVHKKLPTWIGSSLMIYPTFGPAFAAIRKFFADKKKR